MRNRPLKSYMQMKFKNTAVLGKIMDLQNPRYAPIKLII